MLADDNRHLAALIPFAWPKITDGESDLPRFAAALNGPLALENEVGSQSVARQ
jgi:hypothetical protein